MQFSTWDELPWPSWDQAAIAAGIALAGWAALKSFPERRFSRVTMAAALEFALIAGLYSIWRIARQLPFTHESGAIERARDIDRFQQWLHLPSEIGLQHYALQHAWLARFANGYYGTMHVPALIIFLICMWIFFRDRYPHWRNGLVYVTLGCLIIRFVRVAPPRFLPEHDFIDLASKMGFAVYGSDPSAGVSDQYAAMPSIHVAWAAVVACGAVACTWNTRWRWLGLIVFLHLPLTMYAVAATGNHWWLDGVVALILLWIGLAFDTWWRRRQAIRAVQRSKAAVPLASDGRAVEVLEAP
jgi:hypothetical protein